MCETVFTSVLGIAGVVFMALRERPQTIAGLSLGGFILKIIFSIFLYLPHADKWYYILDPNGSHSGVYVLIVLSAFQLFLFFVMIRKCSRQTAR